MPYIISKSGWAAELLDPKEDWENEFGNEV
jgi:hypothetical protein